MYMSFIVAVVTELEIIAWHNQTHSQFKIENESVAFAFTFNFRGAVTTDVDKTVSARSWKDKQPIRGIKHGT